jgi:membrane protein DedA with SNARE-associated domain
MRRWVRNLLVLGVSAAIVLLLIYVEEASKMTPGGLAGFLSNLPALATSLTSQAGYSGLFVLMLLESAAFPLPSEIILPFAGYLVSRGTLQFLPAIIVSTAAALIGSFFDYFIGWKLGASLLKEPSRIPYVNSAHLRKVHVWFERHGPIAVAAFRMVPAARVLISFPAGAYRMRKTRFMIYTLAGCLPWNILLTYLGWLLGANWGLALSFFKYINPVVYASLVLLAVWLTWRLRPKKILRSR